MPAGHRSHGPRPPGRCSGERRAGCGPRPELEIAERHLRVDPSSALGHENLAYVAVARERWAEAEAFLLSGLRLDPESVSLRATLGRVRAKQGALDEGVEMAHRAVRDSPTDVYARGELGRAAAEHSEQRSNTLMVGVIMLAGGSFLLRIAWRDSSRKPGLSVGLGVMGLFMVGFGVFLLKAVPKRLPTAVRAFRRQQLFGFLRRLWQGRARPPGS